MKNMGQLDLVIFDCDGVLVDSEVLTNTVFRDMLKHESNNPGV